MAAITAFLNSDEAGRLKAELQNLRRKGALKPSADWDSTTPDPDRSCGRCRVELGRVINRGAYCRSCRLKVCKGCREYSFRTTDWVCTVCHKRMEIQAASGEWMNEFVRRPSRRRDNRVYVPAADIIKRTIRRSWTISNPTPRWHTPRGSPLVRPYSSLPRGQDISNYPSLASYRTSIKSSDKSPQSRRHSPAHRSHSEDVYSERQESSAQACETTTTDHVPSSQVVTDATKNETVKHSSPRINPLTKAAAEGKLNPAVPFEISTHSSESATKDKENSDNKSCRTSPRRKLQNSKTDSSESSSPSRSVTKDESAQTTECKTNTSSDKRAEEKRVSFEETSPRKGSKSDNTDGTEMAKIKAKQKDKSILKPLSKSLDDGKSKERKAAVHATHSLPEENSLSSKESVITSAEVRYAREEDVPNEQCDIEPLSGTVFRKVTVRRRRQDMRKVPAIDNGWRRGPESDILDILLPEGDDYKLVFLSSDSSSKEEDLDDNDSSSTASSFLLDDCDWDYFEPSTGTRPLLNWSSPFGSPRVYRRGGLESPLGSPLVYRRAKESDTGTDEDIARLDSGSPASSDSISFLARSRETEDQTDLPRSEPTMEDIALQCVHQPEGVVDPPRRGLCQSCGSPTQYVPIAVPVPIPVPVPALWSPQGSLIRYGPEVFEQPLRSRFRSLPRSLWPYVTQAALIWPLITAGESNSVFSTVQNSLVRECAADTNASMLPASERNKPTAAADQKFISQSPNKDTCASNVNSETKVEVSVAGAVNTTTLTKNEQSVIGGAIPSVSNTNSVETACSKSNENLSALEVHTDKIDDSNNFETIEYGFISQVSEGLCGHLASENANMSSSDSSEHSTDEGDSDDNSKPRVRRTYTVTGGDMRESDDALPSSEVSSDCDEEDGRMSQSSVREDDMSSSGSADTDSNDTGTVADQKPKRFSRVLVVNNNVSSSSTSSSSSIIDGSCDSNTDSSDNDTDTEKDCGVILTHIKMLPENDLTEASPVVFTNAIDLNSENATTACDKKTEAHEKYINDPGKNVLAINLQAIGITIQNSADNCSNHIKNTQHDPAVNTKCALDAVNSSGESVQGGDNDQLSAQFSSDSDTRDLYLEPITINENLQSASVFNAISYIKADVNDFKENNNECLSPSPGLSDVSAESHHSSDVEQPRDATLQDDLDENDDNNLHYNNSKYRPSTGIQMSLNNEIIADKKEEEVHFLVSDPPLINEEHNMSTSASIRSDELHALVGTGEGTRGERAGVPVASELDDSVPRHAARYTSLVMITQEPAPSYPQVSVVTSDTTTLVPDNDIVVRHTNWQDQRNKNNNQDPDGDQRLSGYFTLTLENASTRASSPRQPIGVAKSPVHITTQPEDNCDVTVVASSDAPMHTDNQDQQCRESVTVVTGAGTLSAVVCLEDGLADDDSWVENLSNDEDEDEEEDEDELIATSPSDESSSGDEVTLTCTAIDHEDELRGYHRSAIDFTLHTIVEESCEESEVEQPPTNKKTRPASATDLEKYFFFGLGDGNVTSINSAREDGLSETSSICSEGMDSLGAPEEVTSNDSMDPAELASSRLEKYFLSGFMGFTAERRDSDGSVGSDSEGRPSPEQRRKRLVRARGTGRSHSSSLDNLLANSELSGTEQHQGDNQVNSEDLSSSDTDINEEGSNFEKSEGQFDTVKRKKSKKPRNVGNGSNSSEESKVLESTQEVNEDECRSEEDGNKTPQPDLSTTIPPDSFNNRKQQSRDSGFIGSCDDLIKEQRDTNSDLSSNIKSDLKFELERIAEGKKLDDKSSSLSTPPATSLTRKDSFNNWSSDEETNLMMCKMRQFFKTMIANNSTQNGPASKPTTPVLSNHESPKLIPSPRFKNRYKPPQLVYFENELTRLMKTVPGIRDDQVREIVEYLSSEDTWSDSYDSSDYTSSDLEGTTACNKSLLQQQISDSCQEIISKFESGVEIQEKCGNSGDIVDDSRGLNRETAFVYQKLVASFEKMATGDVAGTKTLHTPHNSPPLIAKVMHHIGSRLVALMHEVSSGESHASNSPKARHYHRRLHQKLSNASSTTTEDDDSTSDNLSDRLSNLDEAITAYNLLPRSRSHDLLLSETRTLHQSSSGVSDIAEERETSDYERFSWRGSFESALMAPDSRNKLSLLGSEGSASASALAVAAKRRSAGDLMFSHKSLSREQLDRVRSCGSIGGGNSEDKLWVSSATRPTRRRSSVPDAASGSGGSADGEDDDEDEDLENRATLPRSLQTSTATTNSLPRLPTTTPSTTIYKAHSMYHFLQQNVKSARYRPPGFSKFTAAAPKRAVSAPGLQPSHQRRGRRSQQSPVVTGDDASISETNSSPMLVSRGLSKSATPSPVSHGGRRETGSISSQEWHSNEEDIDRLVAIHHNRSSLSSLGLRSDSMASVYSGAGEGRYGTVAVRGQVEFGLQYNYKAGALEILIKQCKDLAAVDTKRNRSDPYVKVYLLPDKSKSGKRKTKVKKHTLNPVFDENLKFHISLNGLETRTLWLTVWHSDMFGRNDFLGEVMMTLENKVFDEPTPKWYNLQERTEPFEDVLSFKGDILVGLKFVPPDMTVHKKGKRSRGALHVKVKEAKSLTAVKTNGTSDPFCKSYLLPDKGRSSKQKTAVIRKTVNAIWNHTFVYEDVTLQELAERCLELTVWDHDRLGSNEFLGGVRFSLGTGKHHGKPVDWMDSTGKELSLWKSMLERPNFWVEGCLPLRPTLDYRAL